MILALLAVVPLALDRVRLLEQSRSANGCVAPLKISAVAHASSPERQVTISVGCAALVPGVADEAEHLVEAADVALYAAKRRGRNTVVAHGAVVLAEAS